MSRRNPYDGLDSGAAAARRLARLVRRTIWWLGVTGTLTACAGSMPPLAGAAQTAAETAADSARREAPPAARAAPRRAPTAPDWAATLSRQAERRDSTRAARVSRPVPTAKESGRGAAPIQRASRSSAEGPGPAGRPSRTDAPRPKLAAAWPTVSFGFLPPTHHRGRANSQAEIASRPRGEGRAPTASRAEPGPTPHTPSNHHEPGARPAVPLTFIPLPDADRRGAKSYTQSQGKAATVAAVWSNPDPGEALVPAPFGTLAEERNAAAAPSQGVGPPGAGSQGVPGKAATAAAGAKRDPAEVVPPASPGGSAEEGDTGDGASPPEEVPLAALSSEDVAESDLADIRGGFVTAGGLELAFGFAVETVVDGALQLQSVLSLTDPGLGTLPPGTATDGTVFLIQTGADGGLTQVIHQLTQGGAGAAVVNSSSGMTIDQITTLTIDVLNHTEFVDSVRDGIPLGAGPHLPQIMRDALIGSLAR